ncbi:hypothetical protein ACVWYI_006278 [Bradyrhizobium sp. LB13.1]
MPRSLAICIAARRIRVLHDDVSALVDQRLGSVGLLARIEPGVGPDDLHLDVRVDGLRRQDRRIDARDDLRNRERADIAEHAGLRHFGRDQALDVAALVPFGRVGRHVRIALVAGRVLEMHVRVFLRDLQRRIHIAERRREDQLVAGADELLDGPLGVGTFRHVFQIGGLNLVAELLHQRLACQLMLIGPAEVSDRTQIDEADLQLVGGGGCADASGEQKRGSQRKK